MTATLVNPTISVPLPLVSVSADRGGVDAIDRLADEWVKLCDEAADDQPFYRPEWIRAYLHAFAPQANVLLITARVAGRLRLVLPLVDENGSFSKVPVRTLRVPVNHWAGRFDAIYSCGPEGDAAIQATWEYLKGLDGWNLLQLRNVLQGSAVSRLVEAARADGFPTVQIDDNPSPYVPLPTDPELRKLMPVNARLRRQLRQIRRDMAEQKSSLSLHRVESADPEALNRFFKLEASGWKGRERSAILSTGERPFFDEIAASAARFGYFTLYMLELNGQPIAAHYGFTHRDCYYSVVVTYNENFQHLSPGHLIIDEIVNDCASRGVRVYDTTGQNQEWKMKWTTQTRPMSHYFIFKGPRGNLAYTVGARLRPKFDRLMARKPAKGNGGIPSSGEAS